MIVTITITIIMHISSNPYVEVIPHKNKLGNTFNSYFVVIILYVL